MHLGKAVARGSVQGEVRRVHESSSSRSVAVERLEVALFGEAAIPASKRPLPLFQLPAQVVAVALTRRARHDLVWLHTAEGRTAYVWRGKRFF